MSSSRPETIESKEIREKADEILKKETQNIKNFIIENLLPSDADQADLQADVSLFNKTTTTFQERNSSQPTKKNKEITKEEKPTNQTNTTAITKQLQNNAPPNQSTTSKQQSNITNNIYLPTIENSKANQTQSNKAVAVIQPMYYPDVEPSSRNHNPIVLFAGGSFLLGALSILSKNPLGRLIIAAATIGGVGKYLLSKQSVFANTEHGKQAEENMPKQSREKKFR